MKGKQKGKGGKKFSSISLKEIVNIYLERINICVLFHGSIQMPSRFAG